MQNLYKRIRALIHTALVTFSKREWAIFTVLLVVLFASTLGILQMINQSLMVAVPLKGGSISEGIVGTPRFVNPVLAFSDADQDLVELIYSGLMRKNSDGTLSPDLAEKFEMSKDGLTYTFTLRDKIYFQNDAPVTADDVVFTINKVKDGVIKSPHKVNWDGVRVEKVDEKTLKFTLQQAYASFLENATLGIIPQAIWGNSPIELNSANTNPVGSGPYMVKNVYKKSSGSIDYYELVPFNKFALGKPNIQKIALHFYASEDSALEALDGGTIDQLSSLSPLNALNLKENGYEVRSAVLPRVFGLFFNQNQNQLFIDKAVVRAIDQAIDKDRIIREVLSGYAVAIDDPIPPNMLAYQKTTRATTPPREEVLAKVSADLTKAGWVKNTDGILEKTQTVNKKKTTSKLEFSISTGNAPELAQAALIIQEDLNALGMNVDVKTFEVGNLNQGVIRPRKYDVLLFGEIINHESDLFAFWHSSQRKDPGLNVAMYTNSKVDKILEDAFVTIDTDARVKKYIQFEEEIRKDLPAVFLYSPDFIYVMKKNLQGINLDHITDPADRFANIYAWYTETENVWKIFAH
jgi:peptide/nickel transport system substrate-binding protein